MLFLKFQIRGPLYPLLVFAMEILKSFLIRAREGVFLVVFNMKRKRGEEDEICLLC